MADTAVPADGAKERSDGVVVVMEFGDGSGIDEGETSVALDFNGDIAGL